MRPGQVYSRFEAPGLPPTVLRALRSRDLPKIVEFANTLFEERGRNPDLGIISLDRRVSRSGEKKYLDRVLAGIRKDEEVSVAAFGGGRMVGNCDVKRRTLYDVMHTGVLGIAIIDGYRGFGLGAAMVRTALSQARRIGVWLVELQVFSSNEPAIRLYQRLGFRRIGTVPNKILRGRRHIDEALMYIDLRRTDKSMKLPRPGS